MTVVELRNIIVAGLTRYSGRPVRLSDQTTPESEYPYIYYQPIQPYMPKGHANYSHKNQNGQIIHNRDEGAESTFSFTACSANREDVEGNQIYGDDEALLLAEKAQSYFLHAGRRELHLKSIAVIEVMNVSNRTAIEIIETERRYGFDVRVRYIRHDEYESAAVGGVKIKEA